MGPEIKMTRAESSPNLAQATSEEAYVPWAPAAL